MDSLALCPSSASYDIPFLVQKACNCTDRSYCAQKPDSIELMKNASLPECRSACKIITKS